MFTKQVSWRSRIQQRAALYGSTALVRFLPPVAVMAAGFMVLTSGSASAAPLVLSGNYIKIGLNDAGTLGSGGNTPPGILYDGGGTGTFNPAYDYLTPGAPFEGFTIKGAGFSHSNNNSGGGPITGTLTDYSGIAYNGATYDQRAVWTGEVSGLFTITHDYYFNVDSQQVKIDTTITALADLADVMFGRFTDPDAMAAPGDSSMTNNILGIDDVPATDLVYAEALASKYVIGLYTNSSVPHGAGASQMWSSDPADYLSGVYDGSGDFTIGLGFDIGALLSGDSITLSYQYIFGTDIAAAIAESGASGPVNIGGGETYTLDDLINGVINPVFEGGTLVVPTDAVITGGISMSTGGGTIDTAGHHTTLAGTLDGAGGLIKAGEGTLTLLGSNSYAGNTVITGGTLAVGSNASLGDPASAVDISGGTLGFIADTDVNRSISFTAPGSAIDTGNHTVTLSGSVSGDACLVKLGAGKLIIASDSVNAVGACVEEGTLAQNAVFHGNVWVNPGATLRGTGTITGAAEISGRLAPGNSPGTLTFTNSVALLPNGTLQIDIDGTGTGNGAGNYSRVIVTGEGHTFTADGTLAPLLRGITGDASNTYTPEVGTTFEIVLAEGGILGAFDALLQPADGLAHGTQFELFYGAHAILLTVTPTSYATLAMPLNAQAAANAVDALRLDGAGDGIRAGIAGMTAAGLAATFQELSGEIHADVIAAGVEGRRLGRDGVAQRMASLRMAGNEPAQRYDLWVEFVGRTGRIDPDAAGAGFRLNAGGVAVGGDYAIRPNVRAGVGAARIWGDVNARGLGDGSANSSQMFAYATWSDGKFFADATVAHSWDHYDTERVVTLNSGAEFYESRAKGANWAADLTIGARFAVNGIAVEPSAGLRLDEAHRKSLVESGDNTARLAVAKTNDTVAESRIGARANTLLVHKNTAIIPELRAYWLHDLQKAHWQTAALAGESFNIRAAQSGRHGALLGAGLNVRLTETVQLFSDYDVRIRSGETAHELAAGVRLRF